MNGVRSAQEASAKKYSLAEVEGNPALFSDSLELEQNCMKLFETVYIDSSALVKLYAPETGLDRVLALMNEVGSFTTSVITYAESRGVFARLLAQGKMNETEHMATLTRFDGDWNDINHIPVSPDVYRLAGDLLVAHAGLRAMDAIQMASALKVHRTVETAFLTFDKDLLEVARKLMPGQVR